ncbi:hypothetical protein HDU87_006694 [Geranomyces variabilis]|uniref:PRKR-interacting protein 1 n=1 Tax=Geranomyces variabilis TaxID=109894 RepID=A0AAD5TUJ4_9FUNG|nr:hypothetical protein HDU87_006694 [Geranomyces variabilis]
MTSTSPPPRSTAPANDDDSSDDEDNRRRGHVVQTVTETHAARIERLMARVDKPIILPERKEKSLKGPRDFVRNVQGSSAGAGSGEFHVYRALRRKEYARQKLLDENAKEDEEQKAYQERLSALKREADEKTAKNREKRKKRGKKHDGKDKKQKVTAEADAAVSAAPSVNPVSPAAASTNPAQAEPSNAIDSPPSPPPPLTEAAPKVVRDSGALRIIDDGDE